MGALSPAPQLLVASPLRRALRTAELAFSAPAAAALPRLVTPLCRERLYHSSDVGRDPALVAAEFPAWHARGARAPTSRSTTHTELSAAFSFLAGVGLMRCSPSGGTPTATATRWRTIRSLRVFS